MPSVGAAGAIIDKVAYRQAWEAGPSALALRASPTTDGCATHPIISNVVGLGFVNASVAYVQQSDVYPCCMEALVNISNMHHGGNNPFPKTFIL